MQPDLCLVSSRRDNSRSFTRGHQPVGKQACRMHALRRFDTVLQQLKSRDSDELWLSLGSCDLHDARMGALTEALAHNSTVTALDLSRNNITSQGAQARVAPPVTPRMVAR